MLDREGSSPRRSSNGHPVTPSARPLPTAPSHVDTLRHERAFVLGCMSAYAEPGDLL